jgi:hypothetical protein
MTSRAERPSAVPPSLRIDNAYRTPIGATIIGAVGDSAPRFALILGAAACAAAAGLAVAILRRSASPVARARIPVSGKRSHVGDGTTSDRGRLAHATQRVQEHVEQRSG